MLAFGDSPLLMYVFCAAPGGQHASGPVPGDPYSLPPVTPMVPNRMPGMPPRQPNSQQSLNQVNVVIKSDYCPLTVL